MSTSDPGSTVAPPSAPTYYVPPRTPPPPLSPPITAPISPPPPTRPTIIPGATSKEEMIQNIRHPPVPSGTVAIPAYLTVTGRLEQLKPAIEQREQELKKFEPLITGNTFTGTPVQFQQYEKIHTEQSKDIGQYNILVERYNEPIRRVELAESLKAQRWEGTRTREASKYLIETATKAEETVMAWENKSYMGAPDVPRIFASKVAKGAIGVGTIVAGLPIIAYGAVERPSLMITTIKEEAIPAIIKTPKALSEIVTVPIAERGYVAGGVAIAGQLTGFYLGGKAVGVAGKGVKDVGVIIKENVGKSPLWTVAPKEAPAFPGYVVLKGVSVESAKTVANLKAKETVLRNRIEREGIGADKRDVAKLKEITEQIKSIEPTRSEPVVIKSVAESKPIILKEPEIKISKPTPEEAKTVYETKPNIEVHETVTPFSYKAPVSRFTFNPEGSKRGFGGYDWKTVTGRGGSKQILKLKSEAKAEVKATEPKVEVIDLSNINPKYPTPKELLKSTKSYEEKAQGAEGGYVKNIGVQGETQFDVIQARLKDKTIKLMSPAEQEVVIMDIKTRGGLYQKLEAQAAEEASTTITGMKVVPIIITKTEQEQKGVLKQEAPTIQLSKVALVTSAVQETAQKAVATTSQAGITLQKGKQVPVSIIKPATAQEQKRRLLIVPKLTGITKTPQLTRLKTPEKTTLKKPQVPRTPQIPRVPRTPPPKKPPVTKLKSEEKSKALNLGLKKETPKLEAPEKPGKPNPLYPASYEMVTAEEFQLGGKRARHIRQRGVTQELFEELKKSGRGIPTLRQYKKRKGKG